MSQPARRPLCHATCTLPSGESLHLIATHVSLGGAFIVSMVPPALGTSLLVSLYAHGGTAVAHLDARVMGVRLDPSDASKSGFEVLFPQLDDDQRARLGKLIGEMRHGEPPVMGRVVRARREGREHPRVAVHLLAQVRADEGSYSAAVKNVSISGALLSIDQPDDAPPLQLAVGRRIRLLLISAPDDESIEIDAEVARLTAPPEPTGVGLRFLGLDEARARMLERLIVYTVIMDETPWDTVTVPGGRFLVPQP